MLGVVIEMTVKLIPKSQAARVIMVSFDDVVKGGNAVANVIAAGIMGRKTAFPAAGRISPDYHWMDGIIPRKNLAQVLLGIEQMEAKYGLRYAHVFYAGDGNLHPLIF